MALHCFRDVVRQLDVANYLGLALRAQRRGRRRYGHCHRSFCNSDDLGSDSIAGGTVGGVGDADPVNPNNVEPTVTSSVVFRAADKRRS